MQELSPPVASFQINQGCRRWVLKHWRALGGRWGATIILSGRTTTMMAGGEESKAGARWPSCCSGSITYVGAREGPRRHLQATIQKRRRVPLSGRQPAIYERSPGSVPGDGRAGQVPRSTPAMPAEPPHMSRETLAHAVSSTNLKFDDHVVRDIDRVAAMGGWITARRIAVQVHDRGPSPVGAHKARRTGTVRLVAEQQVQRHIGARKDGRAPARDALDAEEPGVSAPTKHRHGRSCGTVFGDQKTVNRSLVLNFASVVLQKTARSADCRRNDSRSSPLALPRSPAFFPIGSAGYERTKMMPESVKSARLQRPHHSNFTPMKPRRKGEGRWAVASAVTRAASARETRPEHSTGEPHGMGFR